jgi:uncharacterized ferritin-like protein (DUF455 family)
LHGLGHASDGKSEAAQKEHWHEKEKCGHHRLLLSPEIGHVAIGNRWYRWLCRRDGLDPEAHYPLLAQRYEAPRLRPPINTAARRAAGFSEAELAELERPA